ncbi:hypothetical protein [Tropicibacter sp. S64]|uniref:hypothetical protein n=1 Tax=Tropicibacter sp. S64 TaxID=3415122 RepID=UPI003C79AE32
MSEKRKPPRPEDVEEDGSERSRDVSDVARGADGLTESFDTEAAARGMLEAQIEAAQAMFTASMAVTTGSFKAMAAFWGAVGQDKGKK